MAGECPSGYICLNDVCYQNGPSSGCDPSEQAGPCIGGVCASGYTCTNDVCCPESTCDSTQQVGPCIDGTCVDGYVCEGGVCCLQDSKKWIKQLLRRCNSDFKLKLNILFLINKYLYWLLELFLLIQEDLVMVIRIKPIVIKVWEIFLKTLWMSWVLW